MSPFSTGSRSVCSEWESQVQLLTLGRSGTLGLCLSEEMAVTLTGCSEERGWHCSCLGSLVGMEDGSGAVPALWLRSSWGLPGSCLWGCAMSQENGEHGRVDGSGQGLLACFKRRRFEIVADLYQNSDQGLLHLGGQISFMSWFCFKK